MSLTRLYRAPFALFAVVLLLGVVSPAGAQQTEVTIQPGIVQAPAIFRAPQIVGPGPDYSSLPQNAQAPQSEIFQQAAIWNGCPITGASVIDIHNQTLGESVALQGVPWRLHYQSERQPGGQPPRSLPIRLSGPKTPASLKRIELEIDVAGQRVIKEFSGKPNQTYLFQWDGKDAKGRRLAHEQTVKVKVGYVYDAVHKNTTPFAGLNTGGLYLTNGKNPKEKIVWRQQPTEIGGWDARAHGLGGWTFHVHHVYDPAGGKLFLGNGQWQGGRGVGVGGMAGALRTNSGIVVPSRNGAELYLFEATGRHLKTLNASTGSLLLSFHYDQAERLSKIEDAFGNATRIERDGRGDPTAVVGPYGQRATLKIDAQGYLAKVTDMAGVSVEMTYKTGGVLETFKNARGHVSKFVFDDQGRLAKDENALGGVFTLERRIFPKGTEVALTTALKPPTTYRVEHRADGGEDRVNQCCCGAETKIRLGLDGSSNVLYPDGAVAERTEQPDPRWKLLAPLTKQFMLTTPSGQKLQMSRERKVDLADPANLLSMKTLTDSFTVNGSVYSSIYNQGTRTLIQRTPGGREKTTTLDLHGRALKVEVPGVAPMRLDYDAKGRLVRVMQGDGAEQRTMSVAYDAAGRIASLTDPLKRTVQFAYDKAGRLTKQTLPDDREIAFAFDPNGNLESLTPPGKTPHTFQYNAANRLDGYQPPSAGAGKWQTAYAYNLDKQPTKITRPDDKVIDLDYDKVGHLQTVTLPGGKIHLNFDGKTEQLKSIANSDGSLAFAYDGFLPTTTTWDGAVKGTVTRLYDNNFRIVSRKVGNGPAVDFKYDRDGLLNQAGGLTLGRDPKNGMLQGTKLGQVVTALEYNSFGERKRFSAKIGAKDILVVEYERDALGRIAKKTETIEGKTEVYVYDYDRAGRLTDVTKNGKKVGHYEYDSNGNRLKYEGQLGGFAGSYDAQDRVLQYGDATFTHTPNGEWRTKTVKGQTTTYDYDVLGNLRSVALPDGTKIEYLVDAANHRIGKKVNGKLVQGFLRQDRLKLAAELDGEGKIVSRFIYAGGVNVPAYMEKGGKTYRILTDHLGSPRSIVDVASGEVAQRMDYDEFGNVLADSNPGFQPFGFAGGLYDVDTKLVRFGARDYEVIIGRWMTRDPIGFQGKDANLFCYCTNDPLNKIDPFGREWSWADFGEHVVGGAAGAAAVGATVGGLGGNAAVPVFGGAGGWAAGAGLGTVLGAIGGGATYIGKSLWRGDLGSAAADYFHPPNLDWGNFTPTFPPSPPDFIPPTPMFWGPNGPSMSHCPE